MNNRLIIAFFLALLVAASYGNTFEAPFVFDDFANISENPSISVKTATLKNLWEAGFSGPSSRRPVANMSFALNFLWGGDHVFGYHLVNMIIHWLCGFCLYLLIRLTLRIRRPEDPDTFWIAILTVTIWLVHPLQTQAVTYIVQRMTSLCALFYVASLYFYAQARCLQKGFIVKGLFKWGGARICFAASIVAGLLALGTKEIAATLPFFVFLYEWYFLQDLSRAWVRRKALYPAIALLVLVIVGLVYLGFDPMGRILDGYQRRDFTLAQRLLTEPRVIFFYISLILLPLPSRLNLDHDIVISQSFTEPISTMVALAGLAGLLGAAVLMARHHRVISFGILWYLGNLVIESSVIGLEIAFEHRNYLPSMLLILALVSAGITFFQKRHVALSAFTVVVLIFSLWTFQRNKIWQNELTLWQDSALKSPEKARPHYNLGLVWAERGNSSEAIQHYRRALEIKPDMASVHTNLAIELAAQGSIAAALDHYEKALMIEPDFFQAHMNIGKTLVRLGRHEEGLAYLEKALYIKPDSAELHNTIGLISLEANQLKNAALHFKKAISLKPDYDVAYNHLGVAFVRNNQLEPAVKMFVQALKLNPLNKDAKNNLKAVIKLLIDRNRGQLISGTQP